MNIPCRLCKNTTNIETLFETNLNYIPYKLSNVNISFCKNCGFCFNNKLSQLDCNDYYTRTSTYTHNLYNTMELQHDRYKHLNDLLKNMNVNFDDDIIDLTSSDGSLLNYLSYLGYSNLTYCDISQENVNKNIKCNHNFRLDILDADDYKKINKKYKLIFLNHTLEHIIDFDKLFDNIRMLINNDSFIYIEVPDINKININRNIFLEISYEHINYFNINLLNRLCRNYNYYCVTNGLLEFTYNLKLDVKACYGLYKTEQTKQNFIYTNEEIIKENLLKYIQDCIISTDKIYEQIDKSKIYSVFGIGLYALYFLSLYKDLHINNIYDHAKCEQIQYGDKIINIKHPNELIENENILILTPNYYDIIYKQILDKNINVNIQPLHF